MIKKYFLTALLAVASCGILSAQTSADILRYSNYNYGFGTARSAAMGGAFSSLGADLSSMVINPAGLGMYRNSEIAISPSLTMNSMDVTSFNELGTFNTNSNKTKFALNNIGFAANLYNGSGGLTSFTLGFAYTKLDDFNSNSRTIGKQSEWSMLDMFLGQLGNSGIAPNKISGSFTGNNAGIWGALMAYETDLISHDGNSYNLDGLIGPNAVMNSMLNKQTSGSMGQYDISGGFNISNVLYLGFGFGLQNNLYKEHAAYSEYPTYMKQTGAVYDLNNFNYLQTLRQESSAWNFKFGAILRPVDGLRISAAIHTPTYISVDEVYYADMNSNFNNGYESISTETPYLETSYNMRTPTRFIGGMSYTLGSVGVLSVDYERVWYNKMKMFWGEANDEDMAITDEVNTLYKPVNNLRVGLEAVVAPNVFARAGYAYYGSMYKQNEFKDFGQTYNVSCGLGYRTHRWGIDIAYIYMDTKDIPQRVFSYVDPHDATYAPKSGTFEAKDIRHNVTLTASLRF